jgi:hypothetical protein
MKCWRAACEPRTKSARAWAATGVHMANGSRSAPPPIGCGPPLHPEAPQFHDRGGQPTSPVVSPCRPEASGYPPVGEDPVMDVADVTWQPTLGRLDVGLFQQHLKCLAGDVLVQRFFRCLFLVDFDSGGLPCRPVTGDQGP